jgi:phospholipid/cholesterol/gamma-HCH transport system substrate-binding protein
MGLEILVGIFVLLGMAALLMLSMKVSNINSLFTGESYTVDAYFSNIGGLKPKSPVKMSGVKVGEVSDIQYDFSRYEAKVSFNINIKYDKIPADSSASIYTAGLLGEQYIGLEAGGDELFLQTGDEIQLTESAIVLERLISSLVFDSAAEKK